MGSCFCSLKWALNAPKRTRVRPKNNFNIYCTWYMDHIKVMGGVLGPSHGASPSYTWIKLIEECTFFRNLSRQVVANVDDYSALIVCAHVWRLTIFQGVEGSDNRSRQTYSIFKVECFRSHWYICMDDGWFTFILMEFIFGVSHLACDYVLLYFIPFFLLKEYGKQFP